MSQDEIHDTALISKYSFEVYGFEELESLLLLLSDISV